MKPRRVFIGAVVSVLVLAGCGFQGLDFFQDDRVEIIAPENGETVVLPVVIEWTVEDFIVATPDEPGGSFVVFVDREPMRPGQSLDALVDDACERRDGCPDEEWFNDRGIYPTIETSVVLEAVPARRGDPGGDEVHEATIVLLDEEGRRSGEAAFSVTFEIDRTSDR